jgi:hypothetical protein
MTNETVATNATKILVAPAILFNVSEYQPSNTCQIQGGAIVSVNITTNETKNDTLCCNNQQIGVNGTQFCQSLELIGAEWVHTIDNFCGNASTIYGNCSQNQTLKNESLQTAEPSNTTSLIECGSNQTWAWAKENNATFLYAYLQNNRPGIDEMARYCQANKTELFGALTADNLVNLFQYDFGVLN